MTRAFRLVVGLLIAFSGMLIASTTQAATCAAAGAQGAAPQSWQSYCWLDFSSYNDTTARSAGGQNFSFTLSDGSTLSFNVRATSSASTAMLAKAAPSWSGAAVGNTSFLNIPGKPILYTINNGSTVTLNITNITVVPPPGVAAVTDFAFVVADAESTDNSEYQEYTTNGSAWAVLDTVAPISGNRYPTLTGVGSTVARASGGGQPSPIGAYIVGSNKPTSVRVTVSAAGLQGVMFAVRFASIKLTKVITGSRIGPSDQFTFSIKSTSSGQVLATGTSSGTGKGPFAAAVISTASGIPVTLSESMASGSVSSLSQYRGALTCTNQTAGSPTVLPNNVVTSSYDFGALSFGDIVECTFNNAAYPHLKLTKALGAGGRIFTTDQFTIRVRQGSTIVASETTAGTGSTLTSNTIGPMQLVSGTDYRLDELASGSTVLSRYARTMACTNANAGSATTLPNDVDVVFTPVLGDVITCILTNTRSAATAILKVTKTSIVLSDGISTSNPFSIPGAIVQYTIGVTNEGDAPADASSIVIVDSLPANMTYRAETPVSFANGPTPSGLNAFNASTMVAFSSQPAGAVPFNYVPAGAFDPAVQGVRISPGGTMLPSDGINHPSFSVSFQMRVK